MEAKTFVIVNQNTGKFYSGIEGKTVEYVDTKESASLISEAELGAVLMKIRLIGEVVEHEEA